MIIFLYGPDTFRSRQKLHFLKDKFIQAKDHQGLNIAHLIAVELTVGEIRKHTLSGGLFSQKRLVIIEDLLMIKENNKNAGITQEIIKLCEKKSASDDDNIIIIWESAISEKNLNKEQKKLFGLLEKQKYAQEFKLLTKSEIKKWAIKELAQNKVQIENSALNLLIERIGSNLWRLNNELNKLTSLNQVGITIEDIKSLVFSKVEENIWDLIDAISNKNKKQALLQLSEQLEAGMKIGHIIGMLVRQYRILLQLKAVLIVKPNSNAQYLSQELGIHPFSCHKGLSQEKQYTVENLKKIYCQLLKIDLYRKSKPVDPNVLLSLLIINA